MAKVSLCILSADRIALVTEELLPFDCLDLNKLFRP